MTKMHSFTPDIVIYGFFALAFSGIGLLVAIAINTSFGEQTVLEEYAGTKSVCAQWFYNSASKTTQCHHNKTVPATCKVIEHTGPVFDTFVNTTCE